MLDSYGSLGSTDFFHVLIHQLISWKHHTTEIELAYDLPVSGAIHIIMSSMVLRDGFAISSSLRSSVLSYAPKAKKYAASNSSKKWKLAPRFDLQHVTCVSSSWSC